MAGQWRTFTLEELKRCNGQNGAPIYVAFEGRVIDVTASRFWRGGVHMKRHAAGADLSAEMPRAPHDASVLERFPQVGILAPAAAEAEQQPAGPRAEGPRAPGGVPAWLEVFLQKHPFFRRHPHPMTVHFPIVFMMFAPLFIILFLATGFSGFEITALNCLAAGVLFCLVVIPTGLLTWWLNYGAAPLPPVTIKIVVSCAMLADGLGAFIWRLADPSVITRPGSPSVPWLLLVFLLLPMVVIVAWFGATLTFPLRREKAESAGP
ncbi:MAG TPA: DUF2231 domain-containing protein [Spirochaetia bacterium]|nr:DUF2231 domain-containing protein [Spirochaetia bacterium]